MNHAIRKLTICALITSILNGISPTGLTNQTKPSLQKFVLQNTAFDFFLNPVFCWKVYIMEAGGEFYSLYVVYCVVNALLCITAILLNITTIHAIRKTSSLPKTLKTLILGLAVSDLGVGLLVHPLLVAILVMEMEEKTHGNPTYNKTYLAYLNQSNLFSFASFFGVAALSADRFLAIHLHLSL